MPHSQVNLLSRSTMGPEVLEPGLGLLVEPDLGDPVLSTSYLSEFKKMSTLLRPAEEVAGIFAVQARRTMENVTVGPAQTGANLRVGIAHQKCGDWLEEEEEEEEEELERQSALQVVEASPGASEPCVYTLFLLRVMARSSADSPLQLHPLV
ncbi:hypothetical protein AK812_SmicGene10818 [Symbiodinium microadriaticum]|uniref:Uncharacterized protein n=1 Tax=Symbiodinium microadriaticum TaxID=2951 RepID=A0A1Q9EES9_SYMMI|nr:hypothetical protein AK812_SmicGene10818 [Symbiodinium microadriaticum]